MAKTAQSLVDVVLGEAAAGTPAQRFEDMKAVASAVVNRANALGVSVKDVISAKGQFDAFGKSLPPGVEAIRSLAEKAVAEVMRFGPTHPGMFYATPSATKNLPSGLTPVTQTAGHVYFDDPQNRAIATAKGFITPAPSVEQAAYSAPTAAASHNPFDALFSGVETAPTVDLSSPSLDLASPASSMQFSNPLGAFTDRVTSEFGNRASPGGVGSTNHRGVDMSAAPGQAGYPAEAAAAGRVTRAGPARGYGNLVEVEHEDGSKTRYGHLADINVAVGDVIARGTPVGTVGNKGASTGPHLHFETIDRFGAKVDPRSVTDFANRGLSVTPSPRPSQDVASAFSSMAAAGPLGFSPSTPDPARFGPADVTPAASLASLSQPSPDRFGYAPETRTGGLGGLGGIAAKAAPDPSRFGPAEMASAAKAGRLSSTVNAANATPMANRQTQDLASIQKAAEDAGWSVGHVTTQRMSPTAMGLLPSTSMAPVGSFSAFNAMPTTLNAMIDVKNTMKAKPLSLPNMPAIPTVAPPVARVAPPAVSPMTTASVRSAPTPAARPSFSAADVYSGRAPAGYQAPASGGNLVSRDQFGNISVTNQFGATTVTDPSGRQMGTFSGIGGVGQGIGSAIGKAVGSVPPGMVGSVIGGAIAGMPGAIVGGMIGNKIGGGAQTGQRTGGLGGLGGFLGGLFGGGGSNGGSSGSRGGGSSGGSRGGRGSGTSSDRDNAGNR